MGYAHLDDGDAEHAINTLEQALQLFLTQQKRDYEGRVLGGLDLPIVIYHVGRKPLNFHKSALHIAREVGDQEELGLQLSNLAHALVEANQLREALLRYRQSLHVAYEADDRENIVSALVDLVRLMLKSNRLLPISETPDSGCH